MNIALLKQSRPQNCGQTTVAMLTGRPVREIEKLYGHKTATYPHQHILAMKQLGYYPDERGFLPYEGKLPELALVRLAFYKRTRNGTYSTSGKTKRSGHLVLWANGKFYDPNGYIYTTPRPGVKIDLYLEVLAP